MTWTNLWICGPLPLKIPVKNFFGNSFIASKPPQNRLQISRGHLVGHYIIRLHLMALNHEKSRKCLIFFYHFRPKTIEIQPKNKLLSLQEAIFVERF